MGLKVQNALLATFDLVKTEQSGDEMIITTFDLMKMTKEFDLMKFDLLTPS
jgi:hypothetical protein